MTFDPSPAARPLFKERALWTLVMGLFFFLVYGGANQIALLTAPHPSFFWEWERRLPFVPQLIVPYMSSDLLFVCAFLLAPDREAIQRLGLRNGLAIVVSAAFFLAVPLEFSFTRPQVDGWETALFDALRLDQPYNQFPSLHISLGFFAWQVVHGAVRPLAARVLVAGWFAAVFASTLLVYQHHAVDLVGGALVAVLVCRLLPERGRSPQVMRFVTPRHLHMALRYLMFATAATVAAFASNGLAAGLFGWVALSLLLVAAAYVLGLNDFLRKNGRRHPLAAWLLCWPYLVGSWVNWRWWRSRVSLMSQVAPGLWIGARPAHADWPALEAAGVRSVIDLVPELSGTTPLALPHRHAPLLDIAIPAPEALDAIARQVDEAMQQGGVYLHCALGMSRSVLAACAWLIRHGSDRHQALAILDRVRPERVRRPYIEISLDLYERYLNR